MGDGTANRLKNGGGAAVVMTARIGTLSYLRMCQAKPEIESNKTTNVVS